MVEVTDQEADGAGLKVPGCGAVFRLRAERFGETRRSLGGGGQTPPCGCSTRQRPRGAS